jgi:hypothetical protein
MSGHRPGRCPGDHAGRGQVDAEPGQPIRPVSPAMPAIPPAAQNKRAPVHDSHLYSGTNARAQDLRHDYLSAQHGSTDAGCIPLVHAGVHGHQAARHT